MFSELDPTVASPPSVLDEIPVTRAAILRLLKAEGPASIPHIAGELGITHEAVRKQMADLLQRRWIESDCETDESAIIAPAPGRPPVMYCLSPAGDHLFPKQYPELMIAVLDAVAGRGDAVLTETLTQVTDDRVARLAPRVTLLPLKRQMDSLRAIYRAGDPFTAVRKSGEDYVLVERNCPYLDVALERPQICSTTVSALRRLTGCEVVRERRFQDGDGRCEFHVRTSQKSLDRAQKPFEWEPPRSAA